MRTNTEDPYVFPLLFPSPSSPPTSTRRTERRLGFGEQIPLRRTLGRLDDTDLHPPGGFRCRGECDDSYKTFVQTKIRN